MNDEIEKFEKVLDRQPLVMPPEIAKAVLVVAKQVRQLGKDEENKFAHFNYVSVDKFYAVIGPLMADAGLFVVVEEDGCEIKAGSEKGAWLTADYSMTIYHESGVGFGPIHRRIVLSATGPQAFGSGLSYVEKYFLRGLFKIPTGESDADGDPQNGMPEQARASHDKGQIAQTQAKMDADPDFKKMVEGAIRRLKEAATKGTEALKEEWKGIGAAEDEQAQAIRDAVLHKMGQKWWNALKAQAAAKEKAHA